MSKELTRARKLLDDKHTPPAVLEKGQEKIDEFKTIGALRSIALTLLQINTNLTEIVKELRRSNDGR